MRKKRRASSRPKRSRILGLALFLLTFVFLFAYAIFSFTVGPRVWYRVPGWVSVNGIRTGEPAIYRSEEGTLLIDMRHARTHADMEGGGYLVQPYWNRVRMVGHEQYRIIGPVAVVKQMWLPGLELKAGDPLIDLEPHMVVAKNVITFTGLDHDLVEIHGRLLIAPLRIY